MDGETTDVVARCRHLAGVDSGANLQRVMSGRVTDRDGTPKCPSRGVEDREETVTCRVDDTPAEPLHLRPRGLVMMGDHIPPAEIPDLNQRRR